LHLLLSLLLRAAVLQAGPAGSKTVKVGYARGANLHQLYVLQQHSTMTQHVAEQPQHHLRIAPHSLLAWAERVLGCCILEQA
jgi:hypothetical protein